MRRRTLVALPVYNEESHILGVLDEVRKYSGEILVIDDGSSDRTPEILSSQTDLRIVTHERNLGYGAAIRSAFDHAVDESFDGRAFNTWLHRVPNRDFHWHFEIQPRIGQVAALELGADMYINAIAAQASAARWRLDATSPR